MAASPSGPCASCRGPLIPMPAPWTRTARGPEAQKDAGSPPPLHSPKSATHYYNRRLNRVPTFNPIPSSHKPPQNTSAIVPFFPFFSPSLCKILIARPLSCPLSSSSSSLSFHGSALHLCCVCILQFSFAL
ncbi:hypothetical protein CI102_10493 [Trichoderma harzianum]|nr:hypothetical protein CI102_10493 [Trichoderma harzianum]